MKAGKVVNTTSSFSFYVVLLLGPLISFFDTSLFLLFFLCWAVLLKILT